MVPGVTGYVQQSGVGLARAGAHVRSGFEQRHFEVEALSSRAIAEPTTPAPTMTTSLSIRRRL
jgi:hypothetical protein